MRSPLSEKIVPEKCSSHGDFGKLFPSRPLHGRYSLPFRSYLSHGGNEAEAAPPDNTPAKGGLPPSPMSLSPPPEGEHPLSGSWTCCSGWPSCRCCCCKHQYSSMAPATCPAWNHPRWKKILESGVITVTGLAPIE